MAKKTRKTRKNKKKSIKKVYKYAITAILIIAGIIVITMMKNPIMDIVGQASGAYTIEYVCETGQHKGDTNGDGAITPEDAQIAFNIYLGVEPYPDNICCADLSPYEEGDGVITPNDAQAIFLASRRRIITSECS